jgi:hypothetical protein
MPRQTETASYVFWIVLSIVLSMRLGRAVFTGCPVRAMLFYFAGALAQVGWLIEVDGEARQSPYLTSWRIVRSLSI